MGFVVCALLWVPAIGRASQPLVTGHALSGTARLANAAILPQDPSASMPSVAPAVFFVPEPVASGRIQPVTDLLPAGDRNADGVGLRAPPALFA